MSAKGSQVRIMSTTRFRPRRLGPEAAIEDAVACQTISLINTNDPILWIAMSLPIGASMPDLLTVSCRPDVFALSQIEKPSLQILAYLRTVSLANSETIIKHLQISRDITLHCLDTLVEAEIVFKNADIYFLSPIWREILPEVIAIEVKVSKWQKAVQQAARNSIFVHKSYVALPCRVAYRVREAPVFQKLGVGLLSVEDDQTISIIQHSPRRQPVVWSYYYKIASLVAKHFAVEGSKNAIRYTARKS